MLTQTFSIVAKSAQAPLFTRHFTQVGQAPLDQVSWVKRDAVIYGEGGKIVFQLAQVEAPAAWSQLAVNVVASKYLRSDAHETSIRQLFERVVGALCAWGDKGGYFGQATDFATFRDELLHLLVHQMAAFNSPVWFNVGVDAAPQCSACFINGIQDSMDAILELVKTEGRLFKYGSGTGTNLSPLRGSQEPLSGGGTASGPVSFMRGYDAFAGVIKSGGKTRRAAKMVILNADHPDIGEFIDCKANEEKKAWALIRQGYDSSMDGEAYRSVFFQNSNNSVRVTDAFMQAAQNDGSWNTIRRTDGGVASTMPARSLLHRMAAAAHTCGDPGVQFHDTINRWHTCPESGAIDASNPCSEYMFLNDTACNLASLNLLKMRDAAGDIDVDTLTHVASLMLTAQEIIVDFAAYPTPTIAQNSRAFRPLGLGYANLGALLMARGLPYDSHAGRTYAAAVTALMGGTAYAQSARLAARKGPFAQFKSNRQAMLNVMHMHDAAAAALVAANPGDALIQAARAAWGQALTLGTKHGFRNAQTTVIAPTGTIAFMMDCDTTGIEPDLALIKYKKLVGGGTLKIVNTIVPEALRRLGYAPAASVAILEYLEREGGLEAAPGFAPQHLPIFDCALQAPRGGRTIGAMGHLHMMAAVQPFLSGAISKTVNLPNQATIDDIAHLYREGWALGLKSVAVYRDGCKQVQPLNAQQEVLQAPLQTPVRRRLPDERQALTHKFSIAGNEGYITVGLYPDGTPGEVFITMSKEGSTISGLMDSLATAISLALQYGVPLKILTDKFAHMRFEPSGFTGNKSIPMAKSISDYLFRWLALRFLDEETAVTLQSSDPSAPADQSDSPSCYLCGHLMTRAGACYRCENCGATSSCG